MASATAVGPGAVTFRPSAGCSDRNRHRHWSPAAFMPRRLTLSVLLALLALAALPSLASAGWFPAAPVDGPTPDIDKLGGVDLARDGTGGVVYLKKVDGVPHVFVSRFNGGQFRPPERVDNGVGAGATERGDRGRRLRPARGRVDRRHRASTAASWRATASSPGRSSARPRSTTTPAARPPTSRSTWASTAPPTPSWAAPGGGGSDIRAARLQDVGWRPSARRWTSTPRRAAGRGSQRSRVAVSAEGNAIVAWGEDHADGRARVYARRVTGLNPSAFPQEVSLTDLGGQAGGRADSIDIDVEDDGSFAWAVFRQDFAGGSRSVARRLLGSTFDPAVPLDGGPSTGSPRIAINGRGQGLATLQGGGGVLGAFNYNDVFEPSQPLHFASGAGLRAAARLLRAPRGDRRPGCERTARSRPGSSRSRRSRSRTRSTLSRPELGPVSAGPVRDRRRPRRGLRRRDGPGRPGRRAHARGRRPRPPARAAGGDRPQRRGRTSCGRSSSGARASTSGARSASASSSAARSWGRRRATRSSPASACAPAARCPTR